MYKCCDVAMHGTLTGWLCFYCHRAIEFNNRTKCVSCCGAAMKQIPGGRDCSVCRKGLSLIETVSLRDDYTCCGDTMEISAGHSVCYHCARAVLGPVFETPLGDYAYFNNEDGRKTVPRASRPTAKRVTHPVSNFREIYLQFLGQTNTPRVPPALMKRAKAEVAVHSPAAYEQIRAIMKSRKPWRRYYRDIFRVLYACGGPAPQEASKHWPRIRVEYLALCAYFERNRASFVNHKGKQHKSMFSTWMMLSFILQWLECPSFYTLPSVADRRSVAAIDAFLATYQQEVLAKRECDAWLRQYYREFGVWQ